MKKTLYLICTIMLLICITGCGSTEAKINKDSKLASVKEVMMKDLNNYEYDVEITINTGIMPVTITMNCKDDRTNQNTYCYTSTYGVSTEEYVDYKNKITYSKVTAAYGGDSNNGKWTSSKHSGGNANTWLNLNDYIFNIKEENRDGGTYYTGTIDSKKVGSAISKVSEGVDPSKIVSDDIDITVFVNSSNYIEQMSFKMKIMGIEEVVKINYKNYNNSINVVIPDVAK